MITETSLIHLQAVVSERVRNRTLSKLERVLLFNFPIKRALMTMLAPYEIACLAVATRILLR
jgi:hypothetical protein